MSFWDKQDNGIAPSTIVSIEVGLQLLLSVTMAAG
jgi:hypothetical protein